MSDLKPEHLALRVQLLTVATLPPGRAWENVAFKPTRGQPYAEEAFVPATATLRGLQGSPVENTGLYVVRLYGVENTGLAITDVADAVLAAFPVGKPLAATNGVTVRVRGDIAPTRTQLLPAASGWVVTTVTIPWRFYSLPS